MTAPKFPAGAPGGQPHHQEGTTVTQQPATTAKPKKPLWKRPWVWAAIAALLLIVGVANAGGEDRADTSTTAPPSASEEADSPTTVARPPAPAPSPPPPPPAPPTPQLTVGQENALATARDYLDYSSFSRTGLIQQLEFEGYSTADATWAVDQIGADWMQQAAATAKEYMDYSSFSRSGLISQLQYEGFTPAEAEYGASQVGF